MEYIEEPFDPSLFGFERVKKVRGLGAKVYGIDYLAFHNMNGGHLEAKLCLCPETDAFVRELLGDTVRVDINAKEQVLLSVGSDRTISKQKKGGHSVISLGTETRKLRDRIGGTERREMKATTYAHGNAVLFTPGGEV